MATTVDPSRKKRVRAGHRASATKAMGRAEDLLAPEKPDLDKLSQLKLVLREKLETLKTLDDEILDMVKEDDLADEIEQADDFKEGLYSVLVRIERVLTVVSRPTPVPSAPSTDPSLSASRASRVKLPKLTIQPFGGDLTTWTPFWESYRAAIHDNPSLTDTEKFNYLQSLLEHTALDAISRFSLTAPNHKEAVLVLEKRFGNKQRIITKHMDALMNLDAVTSSTNTKALRRLYDHVESHTRSLKSLGVESRVLRWTVSLCSSQQAAPGTSAPRKS